MPMSKRVRTKDVITIGGGGGSPTPAAVVWGPDFGEASGNDGITSAFGLNIVSVVANATITGRLAGKDSWVPNIALCPDDTNKNGTDLNVEGVIATKKDSYFGWDLSTLPTGATVSAATLTVNVATAPLVAIGGVDLNHIADGSETWAEATIICSTKPALTQFQNDAASWGSTGEKSITLNATARARIAARMGVGFYTIALAAPNTLFTNMVLESTDEGTNDTLGPRLTLTYSKTVI